MHFAKKTESLSYLTRSEEMQDSPEVQDNLMPYRKLIHRKILGVFAVFVLAVIISIVVLCSLYALKGDLAIENATVATTSEPFSQHSVDGSGQVEVTSTTTFTSTYIDPVTISDIKEYINLLKNETEQKIDRLESEVLTLFKITTDLSATVKELENQTSVLDNKVNDDRLAQKLEFLSQRETTNTREIKELNDHLKRINDSSFSLHSTLQLQRDRLENAERRQNEINSSVCQFKNGLPETIKYAILTNVKTGSFADEMNAVLNTTVQNVLGKSELLCDAKLLEESTELRSLVRTSANAETDRRQQGHAALIALMKAQKTYIDRSGFRIQSSILSRFENEMVSIRNNSTWLQDKINGKADFGWFQAPNSYAYQVLQRPFPSWAEASAACVALSGTLAVEGPRHNFSEYISEFIVKPFRKNVWIGLNDIADEKVWRWMDGTVMTTAEANWASGQPNNWGHGQDCVELRYANGKWNDHSCSSNNVNMQNYALCEKGLP